MIFDFHTHCFPDELAKKVIPKLSYVSGGLEPFTDGTAGGLARFMDEQGVSAYCALSIATNPKQMKNVNNFAASLKGDNVFPFGSIHPDAPDVMEELERIKEMGLRGIKLHPDYQGFFVDDEKMRPIYKKISELGFMLIFHTGEDFGYAPPYHCTPAALAKALKYIDTNVVAAHWGGLCMGDETIKYLCGLPLYFDTSFGYAAKPRQQAIDITWLHGTKRMLFASDCPWHSPSDELKLLNTLGLSDTELDDILWNNAVNLLEI